MVISLAGSDGLIVYGGVKEAKKVRLPMEAGNSILWDLNLASYMKEPMN